MTCKLNTGFSKQEISKDYKYNIPSATASLKYTKLSRHIAQEGSSLEGWPGEGSELSHSEPPKQLFDTVITHTPRTKQVSW